MANIHFKALVINYKYPNFNYLYHPRQRLMKMKFLHTISILIMAMLLFSCCHKHIHPDGEMKIITIDFDWENASKASPEGMTLYFFPLCDNGMIWRFDISGKDGGQIEIPTGSYQMLAFNNDLPGVKFINTNHYNSFTASAQNITASSDTIIESTGMLYGADVSYIDITPCGLKYISNGNNVESPPSDVLTCYPDSLSTLYTVKINKVEGIERVKSVKAALKGVAHDMLLSEEKPTGAPSILLFPLDINYTDASFSSSACAFTPSDKIPDNFNLSLIISCANGKSYSRNFDITQLIMNSFSPRNVIISITGIKIPDNIPPDPGEDIGGIEVGVDGWTTIEVNLDSTI